MHLDLVAAALQLTPRPFDPHRVVEGELFMDISDRVIGPHVVPAMLGQPTRASMHIAVAHMTVGVEDAADGNMLLHYGHHVSHRLVS